MTPEPPMTSPGVVPFSYTDWLAAYPSFSETITAPQAESFFHLAELILNNTARSPIQSLTQRRILLWLLVAHQAQLFANNKAYDANASSPTTPPVGRIASATRGSVSISFDGSALPKQAGWFNQTQYGLMFWQATAPLRQMRFLPGRTHPPRLWP